MPLAHLSIGTETNRVDLLSGMGGFHAGDWRPQAGPTEDTFAGSSLADYRQLVSYREMTVVETIPLTLRRSSQDKAIESTQKLRQAITAAQDYWASSWQRDPVYLAAQASCESEMRYAIIHTGALPEDSNPYGEPFLQRASRSLMTVTLVVERGPWTDTPPGDASECVEIRGSQGANGDPFFLEFDGVDDNIDCGSDASLDDLPQTDYLTVDFWIRADGYGDSNEGRIIDKHDASASTTGWDVRVDAALGLLAKAHYTAGDMAISYTDLDDFTADGQWHHIAACLYGVYPLSVQWYFAIDGHWVATYGLQNPATSAYPTDAANNLTIGNSVAGDRAFEGGIGWVRVRRGSLYYSPGVDFTPEDRCDFPSELNLEVRGLWIREGAGATAFDNSTYGNDGTITGALWDSACEGVPYGQEATCLAQVYVANKHNWAQLTNIHYWDASAPGWSGNLLGAALPFAFMPSAPLQVNDVVVFGIDNSGAMTVPVFNSLVFDIMTALDPTGGLFTIQWRYSRTAADIVTGPWPALATYTDNTNAGGLMTGDAFDTLGVNAVLWEQPSDWAPFDPTVNGGAALGVTGYWVAAIVTAVGLAPTPPVQQNRDIYSVLWPCVTVAEDEVDGDMSAWTRVWSQTLRGLSATSFRWDTLYAGLRQTSRGETFTPYINITDESSQNVPGVTIQRLLGAWANETRSPSGRKLAYTPGGAGDTTPASVIIGPLFDAMNQYRGRYHAFLRGQQTAGAAGDLLLRLVCLSGLTTLIGETEWRPFLESGTPNGWIDMGSLSIEPRLTGPANQCEIQIQCRTVVARTLELYDLILIPVDEWAARLHVQGGIIFPPPITYELDGISEPKLGTISQLVASTGIAENALELQTNQDRPFFVPRSEQRLWFFATKLEAGSAYTRSQHEALMKIQAWRQQRYKSMRGAH